MVIVRSSYSVAGLALSVMLRKPVEDNLLGLVLAILQGREPPPGF